MTKPVNWESRIGRRVRLRDLHILFTVVQYGGMAKAASSLGISQPAVSEAIAGLEHALGARLLDRSRRGIQPTLYADALLRRGRAAFNELRLAVSEIEIPIQSRTGGGTYRLRRIAFCFDIAADHSGISSSISERDFAR